MSQILARKEIDYRKMTDKEKRQLVAEVNILRELRHPNIVRYYERIVDKDNCMIYIIMEYCEGGDLASVIKRCKKEGLVVIHFAFFFVFVFLFLKPGLKNKNISPTYTRKFLRSCTAPSIYTNPNSQTNQKKKKKNPTMEY